MNSGRLVATQAAADQKAADENLHRLREEAIEEQRLREAAAANKALAEAQRVAAQVEAQRQAAADAARQAEAANEAAAHWARLEAERKRLQEVARLDAILFAQACEARIG